MEKLSVGPTSPQSIEDQKQSPPWNLEEQAIIDVLQTPKAVALSTRMKELFDQTLNTLRDPVGKWYATYEKKIEGNELAHTVRFEESGDIEAQSTILYIPGQFDDAIQTRLKDISSSKPENSSRREHWIGVRALYSARDISRVQTVIGDIEAKARALLKHDTHKTITLVGYSCGGLFAKVIADKLSYEFPGRIGLVAHNAPLDATQGFLVRYANIQEVQNQIGFSRTHDGNYPVIILSGEGDMIVPCTSCIYSTEGNKIPTKPLKQASHAHPCTNPVAAKRIYAATLAVQRYMGKSSSQPGILKAA